MKQANYELLPPSKMKSRVYFVYGFDGKIMYQGPEKEAADSWYKMPEARRHTVEIKPMPEDIRSQEWWHSVDPSKTLMLVPRDVWSEIAKLASSTEFLLNHDVSDELARKYPQFVQSTSGKIRHVMDATRKIIPTMENLKFFFPTHWGVFFKNKKDGSEGNTTVPGQ